MEDIYVVSVGARERLLAAVEQPDEHYVVRAGLEPALARRGGVDAPTDALAGSVGGFRLRATTAPSDRGRG